MNGIKIIRSSHWECWETNKFFVNSWRNMLERLLTQTQQLEIMIFSWNSHLFESFAIFLSSIILLHMRENIVLLLEECCSVYSNLLILHPSFYDSCTLLKPIRIGFHLHTIVLIWYFFKFMRLLIWGCPLKVAAVIRKVCLW